MHWPNLDRLSAEGRGEVRDRRPRRLRVVARPRARAAARRALHGALLAGPRRASTPASSAAGSSTTACRCGCRSSCTSTCGPASSGGCERSETLAVVCVSGGMDSAVTAALAAREHRLAFLHANYGQRTEAKELACFHASPTTSGAERAAGRRLLGAAADRGQQPDRPRHPGARGRAGRRASSRPPTCRSATRTCSRRPSRGRRCSAARAVFVGAVWEDSSGYPDCRPEFYRAFEEAVRLGHAAGDGDPHRDAGDRDDEGARSSRRASGCGVPFEQTWSCYQAAETGLRPLRVLPAAPAGLPGGGGGRPDSLRTRLGETLGPQLWRNAS